MQIWRNKYIYYQAKKSLNILGLIADFKKEDFYQSNKHKQLLKYTGPSLHNWKQNCAKDHLKEPSRPWVFKAPGFQVPGCLLKSGVIYATKYFLGCCFPSKIENLWCCKPPLPLIGQKTCSLREFLKRMVITENTFSRCFYFWRHSEY